MEGIHCKLSFNNGQFRRFLFSGSTFLELRNQVKQLLSLTADDFQLCYLDNEGDLIIISSDEELNCARAFTKDVLRIFVNPPHKTTGATPSSTSSCSSTASITSAPPPSTSTGVVAEEDMMDDGTKGNCPYGYGGRSGHHGGGGYHRYHGGWQHDQQHSRGGRGCGRRGGGRHGGPYGLEGSGGGKHWKECKKEKISVKIAVLQSLLDTEGEMSENTKSKLEKKLGKLQKKMEKFEAMKDSPSDHDNRRERRHGGHGGGGNPQARELWMKIKSKKAELRSAEREGRDEAIIKELVGELNALKLEKASMYQ